MISACCIVAPQEYEANGKPAIPQGEISFRNLDLEDPPFHFCGGMVNVSNEYVKVRINAYYRLASLSGVFF
jgi:hypothetical protein